VTVAAVADDSGAYGDDDNNTNFVMM